MSQRHVSNLVTISAAPQVDHHRSLPPNQLTLTDPAYSPSRFAAPPFDPSSFLTTLAAQERRVLELREELQKAESDLSYLKIRWARYGAGRKRGELRPVGQLQSLSGIQASVIMCQIESGGPSTLLGASLRNGTERSVIRKSTQRVFSGSRHTRALSLLSPDATSKQSIEPRRVNEALSPTVTTTQIHSRQPPVSGWSPLSRAKQTVEFGLRYRELAGSTSIHPLANEVLVKGGKRMASDLREGLWTFFEDIRQATVGEEGISGTATRTPGFGSQQQRDSRRVQESDQTRNRAKIKEEVKRVCDEEEMPSAQGC